MKLPIHPSNLLAIAVQLCVVTASQAASPRQETVPPAGTTANSAVSIAATNPVVPAPRASLQENAEASQIRTHFRQDHPVFFSDFVLEPGMTNFGDAVTLKGSSTINGVLAGSSITTFGDVSVNGAVLRDVVVIMGSARLGPESTIGGDVVVLGGKLQREIGARIQGEVVEIDPEKIPGLRGALDWIMYGLLFGRPLPLGVG